MEIDTPEAPVHTFRDFVVHLMMISLGVLTLGDDPSKIDDRQLAEVPRRGGQLLPGRLIAVENIGHSLGDLYAKRLQAP